MSLIINFALANTNKTNEEFKKFFVEQELSSKIYNLSPPKGKHVSASTDWLAIIETIANGLSILTSLWTFYSEFIKPTKTQSNSGIFINIQINNITNNIWIGNDVNSEEELLHKFKECTKNEKIESNETNEKVDVTMWERIK